MTEVALRYVGVPDGPKRFIPEFGCETETFTVPAGGNRPALDYHVPPHMRGDFRPNDLANFEPEKQYRTDDLGRVLCYAQTKAGENCSKRAVNRFPRCESHGGRLHPLDKIAKDEENASNSTEAQALSRYRQFQAGQIGVDDLDDEELAACGFRSTDGRIYKPRNIPREMAQAFTRAIYERANAEIRSLAVDAARTMGEIMLNKTIEPDVRLKAAITLVERNLGKTPTVVAITGDKPFEEIFDDIAHGTREASRARREANTIDVEVVGERPNPVVTVDESGQSDATGDRSPVTGTASDEVVSEQAVRSDPPTPENGESVRDARLYERNEAVLAQSLHFEYDLGDHSDEIKKATGKRYVSRTLGIDITQPGVPFIRIETDLPNGNKCVKHVDPEAISTPKPKKKADLKRKAYTLSDF